MKNNFKVFFRVCVILLSLWVFYVVGSDDGEEVVADGFDISSYDIILDVNEDNTIDVTENIRINFTSLEKHGIYRFVPQWLEYTDKDGNTIKRKSVIENMHAIGDEYIVDTVKEQKVRIKIGNADKYVGTGIKNYVIKYTYDMGKDPYKGFDEFIFHAYGDYWGTEVKNASLQINMPKSIDRDKVNFFLDKYREENANDMINYYVSGNRIYANVNGSLDGALTVDILLPEDYFVGESWNYGFYSLSICLLVIGITIWNFFSWKKFGKDFPKETETVEFYPPEGYGPAEIGYIYNKQTNKKLALSLIVQLALKGYIKIDEVEKGLKKKIQITNLVTDNNKIKSLTDLELIVYNKLFEEENVVILSEHKTFYYAITNVETTLKQKMKNVVEDNVATQKRTTSIYISILVYSLSMMNYFCVEDMDPSWNIIYVISFICIFINIFLTFIMKRRTVYGEKLFAKVKGFRTFLETVEKDNLEKMVLKNPNYFYDILPYTYVLGISKKWIEKFEKIHIPNRDLGSFDIKGPTCLNNLYNDIYEGYSSGHNGSDGGSSGGGCSSCGGGCSSCGGGGSW